MYITLTQAKTALERVINIYEDDGVVDDTHLQEVIDECEGMINCAVASRYTIPITGTNAVNFLRGLVVPILRYKTYTQFNESVAEDMPKMIFEEYKATIKTLDNLAKQIVSVPDASEKTTGRPSHIKINKTVSQIQGF